MAKKLALIMGRLGVVCMLAIRRSLMAAHLARAAASTATPACEDAEFFRRRRPRLRVALVRHGESMNNVAEAEGRYERDRVADPDLSARGATQAAALGPFLGDAKRSGFLGIHPVAALRVSPHLRTLKTAAPAAAALGLRPEVRTDIFEAGGIYDHAPDGYVGRGGLTRAEIASRFPTYDLPDDVGPAGWYAGATKETDDECRARAARVLADLRAEAAGLDANKNVVLVVHYDFICALLDSAVAPETTGPFARWRHHNTAVTVVDVTADHGEVVFVAQNAVAHILDTGDPSLLSGFPL